MNSDFDNIKLMHSIIDIHGGYLNIYKDQYYIKSDLLPSLMKQLKSEIPDVMLTYICAVDLLGHKDRFELIYQILSISLNIRINFKVLLNENDIMQSIGNIFSNSTWYEREIWDMYGILFAGNRDLRRILTDYGFVGHPMRKDFPLTGYIEIDYNKTKGNVEYAPLKLKQDFRDFDSISGWNILHGDEKANGKNI